MSQPVTLARNQFATGASLVGREGEQSTVGGVAKIFCKISGQRKRPLGLTGTRATYIGARGKRRKNS